MIKDNLPKEAAQMELTKVLIEIEQEYVDALDERMREMRNMALVQETEEEGLAFWESMLGFPIALGWSRERRKERIKARLLAEAPMCPSIFKKLVESVAGSEVQIKEDIENYTVIIKFIGNYGVSPYLQDLEGEIQKVIPAHMRVRYEWVYYMQQKLENYSHEGLASYTHEQIRTGGTEGWNLQQITD